MIKQDFYIANLIARYLSEEITPEETIKLTAWREESTAHEILFKKICDEENQKQHFRKNTAFNPSSGWKEVEKRIKRNNNRSRYIKIVSYAAIILLPVLFVSISMKFTSPVSLSDKQFIAQIYSYIFIGLMLDWIKEDMREDPQNIVDRLAKLITGSISAALARFQL